MSAAPRRFYITTAIDYVNSLPHIGTAYEKIGADVLARWHRLQGIPVHFQMGNDEHSTNVRKAAIEAGLSPQDYCNQMRQKFEEVWKKLDISYDGFIQTSEPRHSQGVQLLFQKILDAGDIYRSHYEGWYCESCEAFYTEKDLVAGLCPHHKAKPNWLKEENYFFALSRYRDRLLAHIDTHPEFIQPSVRRNEILSFLREGLEDVSVSRAGGDWGIPLPNDPHHVVYVWFDALINYMTAVDYGSDDKRFALWWPANLHVIGKDITRFHCIIWPAMLMSAKLPLPQTIFGHGFISFKGEKMSKSLGNVIQPLDIVDRFGADPLRYFLLREGSFGRDGDFTWEHFINRYNGDLANGLGNLVSRTIGMATRYQEGNISPPAKKEIGKKEQELAKQGTSLVAKIESELNYAQGDVGFHTALAMIWEGLSAADRYINDAKPWELAKEGKTARINAILLAPFIPSTAKRIWETLGLDLLGPYEQQHLASCKKWGGIHRPIKTTEGVTLFPRIEEGNLSSSESTNKLPTKGRTMDATDTIDITDFAKIDLRVAQITHAEKIEGADKLLKLQVSLGEETRQIVAGIAKHYAPETLIGKKVVVVANLKPVKLRGVESQGMLLAASADDALSIMVPLGEVAVGAKVK